MSHVLEIGGVVAVLLFVVGFRWRGHLVWMAAAKKLGLQFHGGLSDDSAMMDGEYRGVQVCVFLEYDDSKTVSFSKHQPTPLQTVFEATSQQMGLHQEKVRGVVLSLGSLRTHLDIVAERMLEELERSSPEPQPANEESSVDEQSSAVW